MRRIVIESPYAGDVEGNIAYARRCVRDCLGRGESPYASHLFFTQPDVLDDEEPDQRRLGIQAGFAWGKVSDAVAFYVDRGVSRGMREGYREAMGRGATIIVRALDRDVGDPDWFALSEGT